MPAFFAAVPIGVNLFSRLKAYPNILLQFPFWDPSPTGSYNISALPKETANYSILPTAVSTKAKNEALTCSNVGCLTASLLPAAPVGTKQGAFDHLGEIINK
jgi:hypothetical protein